MASHNSAKGGEETRQNKLFQPINSGITYHMLDVVLMGKRRKFC